MLHHPTQLDYQLALLRNTQPLGLHWSGPPLYCLRLNHKVRDSLQPFYAVVFHVTLRVSFKEFQAAVTQGQTTDNAQMKNKCFKQLGDCQERIKEKIEALSQLQAKMAKLMEKKPKEK